MFQSLSVGLRQKLSDIRKLGRGWDGDDADPVRADAVCEVERLLWGLSMAKGSFQEPSIVPKYDGFLQLEWHDRSRSLEFELTPKSWLVMGTDECAGERKYFEAIAPRGSVESLIPFYRWFVREEWLWPSL